MEDIGVDSVQVVTYFVWGTVWLSRVRVKAPHMAGLWSSVFCRAVILNGVFPLVADGRLQRAGPEVASPRAG